MTLIPTQVTFRGLKHDDQLESDVHERVAWLEQFCADIARCRVLVEVPHRHRRDGRPFHVRIDLTVPGGEPIVISHEPSLHAQLKDASEDAHRKETEIESVHRHAVVAVRDAFNAARRRLEDFAREQRGAVKTHAVPPNGERVRLSEAED